VSLCLPVCHIICRRFAAHTLCGAYVVRRMSCAAHAAHAPHVVIRDAHETKMTDAIGRRDCFDIYIYAPCRRVMNKDRRSRARKLPPTSFFDDT
jgi:hypothetical protein